MQCAKTALNSGAEYLGVATVDEAIALREAYVNAPILILGEPPAMAIPLLLAYKIMPGGLHRRVRHPLRRGRRRLRGVRALPYEGEHGHEPHRRALGRGRGIRATDIGSIGRSIWWAPSPTSPLPTVPAPIDFERQVKRFSEAVNALRAAGINPGIVHAANSAAAIRYPEVQLDMVRLGISLYGFYPCPEAYPMIDLKPAMSVKARITDVKTLPVGEGVSYGLNYRSPGAREDLHHAHRLRPTASAGAFPVAPTCCWPAAASTRWATSAWTSPCSK